MNNENAARTDVLNDDGAPQTGRRQAVPAAPIADGKAKASQIPQPTKLAPVPDDQPARRNDEAKDDRT
jgi:hypothetical protein